MLLFTVGGLLLLVVGIRWCWLDYYPMSATQLCR